MFDHDEIPKRLSRFLLLALLVLIFVILHTTILRKVASLYGLRHDAPQILMVTDDCGTHHLPPAAFRRGGDPFPVLRGDCADSGRVEVWYSVPRGGRSGIFLNERLLAVGDSGPGHLASVTTRLRPGVNRLSVLAEGQLARLPYASTAVAPTYVLPATEPQGHVPGRAGDRTRPVSEVWMTRPAPFLEPVFLGRVAAGAGTEFDILAASDCGLLPTASDRALCRDAPERAGFTASGYLVGPKLTDGVQEPLPPLYRHLAATRIDGRVTLDFAACLDPQLPFLGDAESEDFEMTPQEVLTRVYGLGWQAMQPFVVNDHADPPPIVGPEQERTCQKIAGSLALPETALSLAGGNFLTMEGDKLTLDGVGRDLIFDGPSPEPWNTADERRWEGRYGSPGGLTILSWGAAAGTPGDTAGGEDAGTLFSLATEAALWLPLPLIAMTNALASALPVLVLVLIALRHLDGPMRVVVPPLLALAFFVVSMAVQPLMLHIGQAVLSVVPSLRDLGGAALSVSANEYVPLGVLAATLMIPLARHRVFHGPHPESELFLTLRNLIFAAGFILLAQAMLRLLSEPDLILFLWSDQTGTGDTLPAQPLFWATVAWFAVSFAYGGWVLRTFLDDIVARAEARRIAFAGAVAIVILPAVPALTGALDTIAALAEMTPHPVFPGAFSPTLLRIAAAMIPGIAFAMVLAILLQGYFEVIRRSAVTVIDLRWSRNALTLLVVAVAGVLALPSYGPLARGAEDFSAAAYQLLGQFHDLAVLAALAAPVMALHLRLSHATPGTIFAPDRRIEAFLAAAVAGYVALVPGSELALLPGLVISAVAYFGLTRLALRPAGAVPDLATPDPPPGARLVEAIEAAKLLDQRAAHEEQTYRDGEQNWDTLMTRREEIAEIRARFDEDLGTDAGTAKLHLLNNGPGETPMANAGVGLVLGLVFALLFDLTRAIDFGTVTDDGPRWWGWLLDGATAGHSVLSSEAALVSRLQAIVRAMLFWPLLGFVFGALFHRLRGSDGFAKGAVMTGVLLVPIALAGLWGGAEAVTLSDLSAIFGRVLVTGLFLIGTGVLAFDAVTIHRSGTGPAKIRTIYGVPTLISYGSILALATLLQSGQAMLALLP
ncbi:MAG: hypothetical protein ACU0DK_02145 [Pseudooceanicola sp.]